MYDEDREYSKRSTSQLEGDFSDVESYWSLRRSTNGRSSSFRSSFHSQGTSDNGSESGSGSESGASKSWSMNGRLMSEHERNERKSLKFRTKKIPPFIISLTFLVLLAGLTIIGGAMIWFSKFGDNSANTGTTSSLISTNAGQIIGSSVAPSVSDITFSPTSTGRSSIPPTSVSISTYSDSTVVLTTII